MNKKFDPPTCGESKHTIHTILRPGEYSDENLREKVDEWERCIDKYEARTNLYQENRKVNEAFKRSSSAAGAKRTFFLYSSRRLSTSGE